jgi:hypothetical protein
MQSSRSAFAKSSGNVNKLKKTHMSKLSAKVIENRKHFLSLLRTTKIKQGFGKFVEHLIDEDFKVSIECCAFGVYIEDKQWAAESDWTDALTEDLHISRNTFLAITSANDTRRLTFPQIAEVCEKIFEETAGQPPKELPNAQSGETP